ncbi:filamentous hemagglutinin N-terminal domain-containing protein [Sesbania bispinosa]|nr:filamentous hemagglutinin N-terminal domain-containing protein [Sesbania bispinosa]
MAIASFVEEKARDGGFIEWAIRAVMVAVSGLQWSFLAVSLIGESCRATPKLCRVPRKKKKWVWFSVCPSQFPADTLTRWAHSDKTSATCVNGHIP